MLYKIIIDVTDTEYYSVSVYKHCSESVGAYIVMTFNFW